MKRRSRTLERWSPFLLLALILLLWQIVVVAFGVPDFIFPSPLQIARQFGEFGWDPLESTCRHASLSIL